MPDSSHRASLFSPLFGALRRLGKEQPLRLLAVVVMIVVSGALEGIGIASVVPLLNTVADQGGGQQVPTGGIDHATVWFLGLFHLPLTLITALGLVLGLLVAQQLMTLLQRKVTNGFWLGWDASLRSRLYESIFLADWPFFVSQKAGMLSNALTAEVGRASTAFRSTIDLVSGLLVVTVYTALAAFLSWQMTLVIVVSGAAMMFALRNLTFRARKVGQEVTAANSEVLSTAAETISGAKLVKGCSGEEEAIQRFSSVAHNLAHQDYKVRMTLSVSDALYNSAAVVMVVLTIYLSVSIFHLDMAGLVVLLLVFTRLSPRLGGIQSTFNTIQSNLPALDLIDSLTAAAQKSASRTGGVEFRELSTGIALRDVSFAYRPGRDVLTDVSLDVPRGKTVAIVGPSGSGKTTIMDMVMGLLEPGSGAVLIDGVPLSDIDPASWRHRIGYVAQDSFLFHASVRDNLAFGTQGADDARLQEAASLAFATEFIERLPEGWDTLVGDRGVALSGGQRQRLALARAIARDPELLILDEATSALDAESESRIQTAIEHLSTRMTVVLVTHRLATARIADYIYFVEGGRIGESGTWDDVTMSEGRFNAMRALQELSRQESKNGGAQIG